MSKQDIKEFVDGCRFGEAISQDEFHAALKSAYMDRSRQVWFIYRKIKELYPEVDAARIIRECKPYCQGVHIMALGWESKVPEILKLAGI